jgi:iron complex transport system ATP-binding protein
LPKAILLDEPTSHLDFGNQLRILELVRRMSGMGYSVVMTTHDPNHAILLGGKTAILDREGHLHFGLVKELLTETKLCALYRTELRLIYVPEVDRDAVLGAKLGEE